MIAGLATSKAVWTFRLAKTSPLYLWIIPLSRVSATPHVSAACASFTVACVSLPYTLSLELHHCHHHRIVRLSLWQRTSIIFIHLNVTCVVPFSFTVVAERDSACSIVIFILLFF